MEKEKEELDEKEKLFHAVSGAEWHWVRKKAGVFCRVIGEKAVEIGNSHLNFLPRAASSGGINIFFYLRKII